MATMGIKAMLQCSFGKYFNDDTAVNNIRRSYEVVMAEVARRVYGSVPEEGRVSEQTFQKQKDTLREILKHVIENYKKNLPSDARMTLINVLSRSDMPDTKVSDDMVTVFAAGFHSSSQLMTWGLYFLATHPDVELKLFSEIKRVVGCNEAGEQLKVTPANINKLVYMRQVLDETLRRASIGTFASRYQDVESELGGHRIPAGTPVIHALGVAHQNQDLYPDPTKFDPDRFSPENRKKLPAFAFEPFGFAGKRKCMGWKFSITEATIVFAAIVGSFKLSMVPDQVVVPHYGFGTIPSEEIWVTVSKRS